MKKIIPVYIALLLLVGASAFIIFKIVNNEQVLNDIKDQTKEIDGIKKDLKEYHESTSQNNTSNNNQAKEEGYSISAFKEIKAQDIESVSKGKTAVIWIGRQTCGYCALFAPVIEQVSKDYGFTAYYLDLYSIIDENTGALADEKGYNTLMDLGATQECKSYVYDSDGKEIVCADVLDERFGATPMTLFVKDNKLVGAFSGYTTAEQFSKVVEEIGFTK